MCLWELETGSLQHCTCLTGQVCEPMDVRLTLRGIALLGQLRGEEMPHMDGVDKVNMGVFACKQIFIGIDPHSLKIMIGNN